MPRRPRRHTGAVRQATSIGVRRGLKVGRRPDAGADGVRRRDDSSCGVVASVVSGVVSGVLFGEAVACIRVEADHERRSLDGRYDFKGSGGGQVIVASSKGCTLRLDADEEMIEVAQRAAALFPECANLGVDLVREVPSGDIYVLEVNARGGCWAMSYARIDEACGEKVCEQMDGLPRAGRLLADAAVRLAE